ncbi:hypothetical protein MPER_15273, partial [Moniliophthora perniciosa FA553]
IVLTGGSSHLRSIEELLRTAFLNVTISFAAEPDTAVVIDAALKAARDFSVPPGSRCCITYTDILFTFGAEAKLQVVIPKYHNTILPMTWLWRVNGTEAGKSLNVYLGYNQTWGSPGAFPVGSVLVPPTPNSEVEVKADLSSNGNLDIDISGAGILGQGEKDRKTLGYEYVDGEVIEDISVT